MVTLRFPNLTDEQREALMQARTAFPEFRFTENPDGGVTLSGDLDAFPDLFDEAGVTGYTVLPHGVS